MPLLLGQRTPTGIIAVVQPVSQPCAPTLRPAENLNSSCARSCSPRRHGVRAAPEAAHGAGPAGHGESRVSGVHPACMHACTVRHTCLSPATTPHSSCRSVKLHARNPVRVPHTPAIAPPPQPLTPLSPLSPVPPTQPLTPHRCPLHPRPHTSHLIAIPCASAPHLTPHRCLLRLRPQPSPLTAVPCAPAPTPTATPAA